VSACIVAIVAISKYESFTTKIKEGNEIENLLKTYQQDRKLSVKDESLQFTGPVENKALMTLRDPVSVYRYLNKKLFSGCFPKCVHCLQIIPYHSCEYLFSRAIFFKPEVSENRLCCVLGESKLTTLMVLSTDSHLTCELSYNQNVLKFTQLKVRKVPL
jgi:hypothetical protein